MPSFVPHGFANQFAAMPSLHVGWALWCGVLIWRHAARRWVRWLGLLYPALIALVVLATGNHYLLDVLGGVAAMAIGVAAARMWPRARQLKSHTAAS